MRGRIAKARSISAAVALSVSLSGLAAQAVDPKFGNIKANQTGSITIYKHEYHSGEGMGTVGDTTDTLASDSKPVADVVFTSFPVTGLPLTGNGANANWKKLSQITTEQLSNACASVTASGGTPTVQDLTFGAGQKLTKTNAQGKTSKTGLAVGAYLLCETEAPSTVVSKAAPILATIPHPDPSTKKWHYDITIYPKNSVTGLDKTVKEQPLTDLGLGRTISWTVTATVPQLASDEHLTYFIVKDPMTDNRIASKGVDSVKIGNTVLTNDQDFKVTITSNMAAIGLTKQGLTKAEAQAGQKVTVVFTSTLKSVGNGKLDNTAELLVGKWKKPIPEMPPTNPNTPPSGGIPPYPTQPPTTPKVTSNWGNVKLKKVDSGDHTTPLAGAKFQVFAANSATRYAEDCSKAVAEGNPLQIGASKQTEFESNAKGEVVISGLFVSDSKNAPVNKGHRCYIIKEIEPPAGYVLPKDPQSKVKVTIGETTTDRYDVTIENSKSTVPQLPLTGAAAQVLLPIIGGVLILGGLAAAYAYRRRKAQI